MRRLSAIVLLCALFGCAGTQKPTQTTTADPATTATIKDLNNSNVQLAQQNLTLMTAIQKSQQDAQELKTSIGTLTGKLNELTTKIGSMTDSIGQIGKVVGNVSNNQFRIGQWVASASHLWRLRLFGTPVLAPLVQVPDSGNLVGSAGRLQPDAGAGPRSAVPNSQSKTVNEKSFWWGWPPSLW